MLDVCLNQSMKFKLEHNTQPFLLLQYDKAKIKAGHGLPPPPEPASAPPPPPPPSLLPEPPPGSPLLVLLQLPVPALEIAGSIEL